MHNLTNIPGWRTKRKIVIIESDDWGSQRMPDREVYNVLLKEGYRVDTRPYERYDSLASEDDLSVLFDVLTSFNDKNGNHPIITANTIVANPNFEKIKESDFQNYIYEPFTKTLQRYPNHIKSFDLWKEGMSLDIFHPQFHGREHFNILKWLELLRKKDKDTLCAFNHNMVGIPSKENPEKGNQLMVAYQLVTHKDILFQQYSIEEGLRLFKEIFGYDSMSFIAPCYTWGEHIESTLSENGVKYIQGGRTQQMPRLEKKVLLKRHYLGQKNRFNQIYLVRNCSFEPTLLGEKQLDTCLKEIEIAFKWHKPAIISSHRVNYIGNIDTRNRGGSIRLLNVLFKTLLNKWSDVEFLTSNQLGMSINNENRDSL